MTEKKKPLNNKRKQQISTKDRQQKVKPHKNSQSILRRFSLKISRFNILKPSNKKNKKPAPHFIRLIKLFVIALVVFLFVISGLTLFYIHRYSNNYIKTDISIDIKKGSSLRKITNILHDNKIIADPVTFYFYNKFRFRDKGLFFKAGEYYFQGELSANYVADKLLKGEAVKRYLTIAEGLTTYEILNLINSSELLSGEVKEQVKEGDLLPETYLFKRNYNRNQLVLDMKKAMSKTLDELWQNRSSKTAVTTKQEALILASIIEKETGVKLERRRVSAVFNNRLKKNMMLQTDPTVIYAITLGKYKLDRPLYYKDLRMDSPYNTYKIKGLPPTPIASPGRAAIEAALNPIESKELYFVADGTGGHQFAEDLPGHLRNVKEWRKVQKSIKNNN